MPLVSVIIPTYNRTGLLRQTLQSIQQQTFRDFEVIVVDDGTPGEENRRLCESLANVRYVKIDNTGGPIRPRNIGIGMATGNYVAFVDDDDLWLPQKLEKQVAVLEANPEFGLVHGYCKVIDHLGNETGEIVGRLNRPMQKHGYVFDRMVGRFTVMMSTPLLRKEVIEKAGLFNENMSAAGEDMEFYCRVAFYTPFYFIDQPLALYRVHPGGISNKNFAYNYLPLELYRTLLMLKRLEGMGFKRFWKLRAQLVLMQLGMVCDRRTYWLALCNSLKILPFLWFYPKAAWAFVIRFRPSYLFKPNTVAP